MLHIAVMVKKNMTIMKMKMTSNASATRPTWQSVGISLSHHTGDLNTPWGRNLILCNTTCPQTKLLGFSLIPCHRATHAMQPMYVTNKQIQHSKETFRQLNPPDSITSSMNSRPRINENITGETGERHNLVEHHIYFIFLHHVTILESNQKAGVEKHMVF